MYLNARSSPISLSKLMLVILYDIILYSVTHQWQALYKLLITSSQYMYVALQWHIVAVAGGIKPTHWTNEYLSSTKMHTGHSTLGRWRRICISYDTTERNGITYQCKQHVHRIQHLTTGSVVISWIHRSPYFVHHSFHVQQRTWHHFLFTREYL